MHMNTEVGVTRAPKMWRVGCVALGLLLTGAAATARAQNAAVYTYHNDTLRTGWQRNETVLTPTNAGQLTLLHKLTVYGRISAQPLVVSNQSVNGKGQRSSVVYVVTDQDILYAFDGDTGENLGSTHFGAAVPRTTLPNQCTANSSVVGIASTPVIDPQASLIYLIADTYEVQEPVYRVHAVSLSTLQDTVTPAPVVSASASLLDGSQYSFNARRSRASGPPCCYPAPGSTPRSPAIATRPDCRRGAGCSDGGHLAGHAPGQLPHQSDSAAIGHTQASDPDMDVGIWTLHANRG